MCCVANRLNRPIDELKEWAGSRPSAKEPPPEPTGIEELDSLRSALVDNQTRIEELLERERSFSSQVSHQLRTPVAAMRVAVETELGRATPGPIGRAPREPRPDSTASSRRSAACSHSPATPTATRIDCDMLELCRDDVAHWQRRSGTRRPPADRDGDAVRARVDAEAIGHVLDVLVDNSLHHGKGDITVVVRTIGVGRGRRCRRRGPGTTRSRPVRRHRQRFVARHRVAPGEDSWPSRRTAGWSWSHTENTTFRLTIPL